MGSVGAYLDRADLIRVLGVSQVEQLARLSASGLEAAHRPDGGWFGQVSSDGAVPAAVAAFRHRLRNASSVTRQLVEFEISRGYVGTLDV